MISLLAFAVAAQGVVNPREILLKTVFTDGTGVVARPIVRTLSSGPATVTCALSGERSIEMKVVPRVNDDGTVTESVELRDSTGLSDQDKNPARSSATPKFSFLMRVRNESEILISTTGKGTRVYRPNAGGYRMVFSSDKDEKRGGLLSRTKPSGSEVLISLKCSILDAQPDVIRPNR